MDLVLDPFLAHLNLYVNVEERLLIYSTCGYAFAVDRSQITSHLRDKHGIGQRDRSGLTKRLNTQYTYGFRNPAEVLLRTDGSDIHPRTYTKSMRILKVVSPSPNSSNKPTLFLYPYNIFNISAINIKIGLF